MNVLKAKNNQRLFVPPLTWTWDQLAFFGCSLSVCDDINSVSASAPKDLNNGDDSDDGDDDDTLGPRASLPSPPQSPSTPSLNPDPDPVSHPTLHPAALDEPEPKGNNKQAQHLLENMPSNLPLHSPLSSGNIPSPDP